MFGEYIDSHNHMHALNWDEWELLGATGMRAAVLSCGNPHLYREVWDEAPGYDDIMRFWEGPIDMAPAPWRRSTSSKSVVRSASVR